MNDTHTTFALTKLEASAVNAAMAYMRDIQQAHGLRSDVVRHSATTWRLRALSGEARSLAAALREYADGIRGASAKQDREARAAEKVARLLAPNG